MINVPLKKTKKMANEQQNQTGNSEWLPIVANGLGILGSAASNWYTNRKNANFQSDQNTKDRQFQWDMYWQQRSDALSDFDRANAYNSPEAQMARFKRAGLNPNLMYKQTNTAESPRSSQAGSGSQPAPKLDSAFMTPIMQSILQLTMQMAQTSHMQAQQSLMRTEGELKGSQIALNRQDLQQKHELFDTTKERGILENQKIRADIMVTLDRNDRERIAQGVNLEKTVQEIMNLKAQNAKTQAERLQIVQATKNLVYEGQIKALDADLAKSGVKPSDPAYARAVQKLINGAMDAANSEATIGPGKHKVTLWEKLMMLMGR